MSINDLLRQSRVKQDDKIIDKIVAGVLAAPQPPSLENQFLWQTLFDAQIDDTIAQQLNDHLNSLREEYKVKPQDVSDLSVRKQTVISQLDELGIDATIVTVTDEFQGEYISDHARRLHWLTGFSGSAGLGIVGQKKSAVFSDGRYTTQVAQQVNNQDFDYCSFTDADICEWIKEFYPKGSRIGFNAHTISDDRAQTFKSNLKSAGILLVPLDIDPIDMAWHGQPLKPISPIVEHPLKYAGQTTAEKYKVLQQILDREGADAAITCLPDCMCWLLNIRGGDIQSSPFVHSYGVITRENIHFFVDPLKVPPTLTVPAVIHDFNNFYRFLYTELKEKTVILDSNTAPFKAAEFLRQQKCTVINKTDICLVPKSCKNPIEVEGARQAHIIDGVAMVKFLYWLEQSLPSDDLNELMCANKLAAIRFEHPDICDVSFKTISGVASNAAMPHYSVDEASSKPLTLDTLYLVDSGGQYKFGTTDITRTIALGNISDEHQDRFTRVLKGMIALHTIKFPHGYSGMNLDILARQFLLDGGYNYLHGTGHGVGSYLSVHEGPARISSNKSSELLRPGMIFFK